MNKTRIDFTQPTKKIVSERAGYQCSYPTCNRRTHGPGAKNDETSNSGTAAHIYSAAAGGPRGQGGLSDKELRSPENAIWLCRDHGTLIDNNRGDSFPPQLLLSYKQMHEARVAHEHQGLYSPIGWIHSIDIHESPIFKSKTSITLGKLNLIVGGNVTGKSALCEWICGIFEVRFLDRWRSTTSSIKVNITYFAPQQLNIGFFIKDENNNRIFYSVEGKNAPTNPLKINTISPRKEKFRLTQEEKDDDLIFFAKILNTDPTTIENLIDEIHNYPHKKIDNIHFKIDDENCRRLYLDVDSTCPKLPFLALSGREKEKVFIEFLTALARFCGRYAPTLLLLDGFISISTKDWFDYYSHHFLDAKNQFQTIITTPSIDINPQKIKWNGWQIIKTFEKPPNCGAEQNNHTT